MFGEVADDESLALVTKIESLGSRSGAPKGKVTIADSGVL